LLLAHQGNQGLQDRFLKHTSNNVHITSLCAVTTFFLAAPALHQLGHVLRPLVSRSHVLYLNLAVRRDYSSPGHTCSTSTTSCAATTRLRPHVLYLSLAVRLDYSSPAARALRRPCRAPRLLVSDRTRSTSTSPCVATTRLWPHALYVDLAVRRDYSSPAARALRRPRRAP
jgi:hypothetical protein